MPWLQDYWKHGQGWGSTFPRGRPTRGIPGGGQRGYMSNNNGNSNSGDRNSGNSNQPGSPSRSEASSCVVVVQGALPGSFEEIHVEPNPASLAPPPQGWRAFQRVSSPQC